MRAEETASPGSPVAATLLRLTSKTLGGEQFWADEFIQAGWRIQRHVETGHYRLLDSQDYRRATGGYDTCRAKFEAFKQSESLPSSKKRAVVLLHGLLRSRDTMQPLADYLAKLGEYEVVNVSYPSTRGTVSDHAASLGKVLDRLEGVEEVNFVGHSLGNLVIRCWMHDHANQELPFQLGRFVMLGPPNNGAAIASVLKQNPAFLLTGQSGKQLATGWEDLNESLCIPPCEFGIVAGAAEVSNPLIPGRDDLVVGVEETKLPGAADFCVLPLNHAEIRKVKSVGDITLHFLQQGCFKSEEARVRLPDKAAR
jgi:pimeloyl-ACP methyl ester carboxylesterase